ncbi:MAG: ROK family protein, partial [Planctomycetota bacterium]
MSTPPPVIGVDLGGTHLQAGLVDHTGAILHRLGAKTNADRGVDAVLDAVADAARACCEAVGVGIADLGALGFAAPGAIDFDAGVVIDAPNIGWSDVPACDALSARLGGIAVALENDVNAAALAEARI